jgi:hypothetical protein
MSTETRTKILLRETTSVEKATFMITSPEGKDAMQMLTWLMGSFVGGLPLLAVLVARVVVVSMIEVDISDCMAVAVDSVVIEEGTSPTSLTFPTMAMLASFSAAIFRTFKPL